jgi:hypothetical protein
VAGDWEKRLIEDLARLRREPPFQVDVTARVLAEVRRMGPPPLEATVSRRALAWSAAAALVLAAALTLLALPGLPGLFGDLGRTAGQAADLGGSLFRWAAVALAAAAQVVARTVDFLAAFRGIAGVLAPLVVGGTAAALAGMAGITSYVVGRDLLRARTEAM